MKKNKTRKHQFARGMALFWAVGLVVIALGLGWLWFALDRYEASTPEAAVRYYLQQVAQGEWDALYEESRSAAEQKISRSAYTEYLKETYQELPENPRLVRTGEEGETVYRLYEEEGKQIASLCLIEAPEGEKYAYQVDTLPEYLDPLVIELPQGTKVLLDGEPLPESALRETVTATGYEDLPEGTPSPQLLRYELTGLLTLPKLEVEGANEDPYQISGPSEAKGEISYQVTRLLTQEQEVQAAELAQRAAKTYAAFVTQDASREEINALLLPGTPFYRSMQQFYNGWYVEHTGHDYRNLVCDAFESAGEDAFSVHVSFDYVILRGTKEYLYPSSYRLYFLRTQGEWKLVRLDTL